MAEKFLNNTGLGKVWEKVKEKDAQTLQAAENYTDSELLSLHNDHLALIQSLEGNFTDGKAKKAIADQNGDVIHTTYVKLSEKGVTNGVATLNSSGKIPSSQLPSFVDDVIEGTYVSETAFNNSEGTAVTLETGKIYLDSATNKTYRWSGSKLVEISSSLAIGTTTGTAYDGGLGHGLRQDLDNLSKEMYEDYVRNDENAYIKGGLTLDGLLECSEASIGSDCDIRGDLSVESFADFGSDVEIVGSLDVRGYLSTDTNIKAQGNLTIGGAINLNSAGSCIQPSYAGGAQAVLGFSANTVKISCTYGRLLTVGTSGNIKADTTDLTYEFPDTAGKLALLGDIPDALTDAEIEAICV